MTEIKKITVNSRISWPDIKFALTSMSVGAVMAMLVVIAEGRV
jgi:hypothetical protein